MSAPFQNLNADQFAEGFKTDANAVVLDVRTPEEVAEGYIAGMHQNIDFRNPDFVNLVDELDRNKTYYIYCRSGARSANACMQMSSMGFEKLYNLQGGILGFTGDVVR